MRPAKLFLIALALVLVIGGVVAATRTKLLPVSGAPTQHGLANQPSASGVPTDASGNPPAASLADLTAQASQGSGFDGTPFALIPPDSSPVAPDFILTTLDGKTVKLSDAVKKGPVLLDFWAIWCGPCRMEMPELGAVYSKYKSRGFQVYGINSDATVPQIKRFFTSGNPGYTMLARRYLIKPVFSPIYPGT